MIIGEEDGTIVSSDPKSPDAQLAEVIGPSQACGKGSGTLSLIEYKQAHYLLGAAHSFYQDGKLKCKAGFGFFQPDTHYKGQPNVRSTKKYRFQLPPLNHETALKKKTSSRTNDKLNDCLLYTSPSPRDRG